MTTDAILALFIVELLDALAGGGQTVIISLAEAVTIDETLYR